MVGLVVSNWLKLEALARLIVKYWTILEALVPLHPKEFE